MVKNKQAALFAVKRSMRTSADTSDKIMTSVAATQNMEKEF